MSIFASYVTKIVPLPFDEPHAVTIQKLSGKHLAAARQASVVASMDLVRSMGGATIGQEVAAVAAQLPDQVAAVQADPMKRYDRSTVLVHGVKAWTYQEAITADTLADLTDDAAEFLAREILTLTLPNGAGEKKTVT